MASQSSHPLAIVGSAIIALAVIVLLVDASLRYFRRQGLVQGAVPKKRDESLHDHQQRNRDFDDHQIAA